MSMSEHRDELDGPGLGNSGSSSPRPDGRKMRGQMSFDTVIPLTGSDDVEGCYKLEDESWKVFYFTHWNNGSRWNGDPIIIANAVWPSGIGGVDAVYPASTSLNKASIMSLLSDILGDVEWTEVMGPDSLTLK